LICVGSLNYSPVFKSHCCAFGKACEDSGYTVRYLFSREYDWMLPTSVRSNTIFVGNSTGITSMLRDTLSLQNAKLLKKILIEEKPTHVYLHNYHILNNYVSKICRKQGIKFIYHAHEPYVENKHAHGGLLQFRLHFSEYMEARLLRNTDVAIVSSKEGSRLFEKRYSWFQGRKLEIPLLYEDLYTIIPAAHRQFITFVGPPVPAKGPDIFLKIVDYADKNNLGWSFLLISRKKITNPDILRKRNLTVFHKERITDEEYGNLIRRSFVVITPYKRETQSSAILVSYMYGTPVVSSNVGGLSEFVLTGKTGYLVDIDAPIEEWIEKIDCALRNVQMMPNCRRYFIENFSGKNWVSYLDNLFDD
jgi:glycosyltransferase involved in cell wall biosynthesis